MGIDPRCFVRRFIQVQKGVVQDPFVLLGDHVSVDLLWNDESLMFVVCEEDEAPWKVSWPKYSDQDACVLYLDTRPDRKARSMQKHCYQFLLLPEAVGGVQSQEITHHSHYETRALFPDNKICVRVDRGGNARRYEIVVPTQDLYGWEEDTLEWSFAFRYFSHKLSDSLQYPISNVLPERIPYVWTVCHLKKG